MGRRVAIWLALALALMVPLVAAGYSPYLAFRDPVYIVAGFAGIIALALMLVQPLLASGVLPGVPLFAGRRAHRWLGAVLVLAVAVHVGGLWITSPPDVVDALTFTSPTPFSAWGVLAMWAVFGAAMLAVVRRRLRLRVWRLGHSACVVAAVAGTIAHAVMIQGTMEPVSRAILCVLVALATLGALARLRPWARARR